MQRYIPYSDDFLFQDPELIDEYKEWQTFAKFLAEENTKKVRCLNEPEKRRRLKRHLLILNKRS